MHPPLIEKLKTKMQELISKNLPIETSSMSYAQAIELFERQELNDTRNLLRYKCPPRVEINCLGEFTDLYYAPLLVSTGYLKTWEIMKYGQGFLLRFPTSSEPDVLPEFHDIPQLFKTYEKYKKWGKQIGVTTAASLNELVKNRMENLKYDDGFEEHLASDYHINEVFCMTEEKKKQVIEEFKPYVIDSARDELGDYYDEYEIEI